MIALCEGQPTRPVKIALCGDPGGLAGVFRGIAPVDPTRWGRGTLQVVGRGQEFVSDICDDTQATEWLCSLFDKSICGSGGHRYGKSHYPPVHSPKRPPAIPEPRIWRYIVVTDGGHAPCVYRGMLSLCICKPGIRRGANVGDWVIGFMQKKFGPRVVWAGRVSEILPMGQYCARYSRRPDAIYELVGLEPDGSERLRHRGGRIHVDAKGQATDKWGKYALIFREFWYWGGNAPPVPHTMERLAYYRQGQTTRNAGAREIAQLKKWLSHWKPGVHGRPRDAGKRC